MLTDTPRSGLACLNIRLYYLKLLIIWKRYLVEVASTQGRTKIMLKCLLFRKVQVFLC